MLASSVDRDVNGGPIGRNWLPQWFQTFNLSLTYLLIVIYVADNDLRSRGRRYESRALLTIDTACLWMCVCACNKQIKKPRRSWSYDFGCITDGTVSIRCSLHLKCSIKTRCFSKPTEVIKKLAPDTTEVQQLTGRQLFAAHTETLKNCFPPDILQDRGTDLRYNEME